MKRLPQNALNRASDLMAGQGSERASVPWKAIGVASALLAAIGAVGPWQHAILVDLVGIEGNGRYSLGLVALGLILLLISDPSSRMPLGAGIVAAAGAYIPLAEILKIRNSTQMLFGQEVHLVTVGWGLWLSVGGAAGLSLCCFAYWQHHKRLRDAEQRANSASPISS